MIQFWLGLVAGVIIGWIIEWVIDWQFWRRETPSSINTGSITAEEQLRQELEQAHEEILALQTTLQSVAVATPAPSIENESFPNTPDVTVHPDQTQQNKGE